MNSIARSNAFATSGSAADVVRIPKDMISMLLMGRCQYVRIALFFMFGIINSLQSKAPGEMSRIYWELAMKTLLE